MVSNDMSNLYLQALKIHLKKEGAHYKEKSIYIQESSFTTEDLPQSIDSFKINYIYQSDIASMLKKQKKVYVSAIIPVTIVENTITINVVNYVVRNGRKVLAFTNDGGTKIEYKFDCIENKFIMTNK